MESPNDIADRGREENYPNGSSLKDMERVSHIIKIDAHGHLLRAINGSSQKDMEGIPNCREKSLPE